MSAKYSSLPALRLIIGRSGLRRILHGAFCLCIFFALYLVYTRGYPALALLLLPPVSLLLWRIRGQPMAGAVVCWRQGNWSVERGVITRAIRISANSTCLPWVIYLAWRELPADRGACVWLFADSAPPRQLRRLRARLALQG